MSIRHYQRVCPFCKQVCIGYEGSNLFCRCNAKYYWQDQTWLDRKTGKEVRTMTNREYLATIDNTRYAYWVLHDAVEIARMSTQSLIFLAEWLDEEYDGWITISERSEILMERWKKESGDTE